MDEKWDLHDLQRQLEEAGESFAELARRGREWVDEAGEWLSVHNRTLLAVGGGIALAGLIAMMFARRGGGGGGARVTRLRTIEGTGESSGGVYH